MIINSTPNFWIMPFLSWLTIRGFGLARRCDLVVLGTIVRDTTLIVSTAKKMGWGVDMVGQAAAYDTAVAEAPVVLTFELAALPATARRRHIVHPAIRPP